ncbi:MAG: PilZ domain-containing protein [Candidatus Acidiferrales bacterium]
MSIEAPVEGAEIGDRKPSAESRGRARLKMALPVHVQPFDPRFADIADVGEVVDFSRQGLYFASCMPHYFQGMRLLVKFPYGERASTHKTFLGTVVRIEDRQDGSVGIGVKFLV